MAWLSHRRKRNLPIHHLGGLEGVRLLYAGNMAGLKLFNTFLKGTSAMPLLQLWWLAFEVVYPASSPLVSPKTPRMDPDRQWRLCLSRVHLRDCDGFEMECVRHLSCGYGPILDWDVRWLHLVDFQEPVTRVLLGAWNGRETCLLIFHLASSAHVDTGIYTCLSAMKGS